MRIEASLVPWRTAQAYGLLIVAALALPGCERKVALQLAPDIGRASEMVAVLGARGIEVERKPEKSGVMLSVAGSDFPRAMQALRDAGLLRPSRATIDEALGKRGIALTPSEALARRVHAIERDLEATVMDIDGVVSARVRIVPPERPAPGLPLSPASASVFVKHRADVDLSPLAPGIARLVKHGAPGLAGVEDGRVAIVLVPEQPIVHVPAAPGGVVVDRLASRLIALAAAGVVLGCLADRLVRRIRRRGFQRGEADGVDGQDSQ